MARKVAAVDSLEGWIPIGLSVGGPSLMVDWCFLGARRFDLPFFRNTVEAALQLPFNRALRRQTPIEVVVARARECPGIAPTAFVFHASRCGSTLLAKMLMGFASHIVLSEPEVLDFVLHGHPFLPHFPDEARTRWLRALVAVLGQPRGGRETRLVIKLDPLNILSFPLLRNAFPETPWIFLYRDPLEIAVSQCTNPAARMIPGNLGPSAAIVPVNAALQMPHEEYVARTLGGLLDMGATYCAKAGGLPVNYLDLPNAVGHALASTLGVESNAANAAILSTVAELNAKSPDSRFVPDSARKRAKATPALRQAVETYAMPQYRTLETMRAQLQTNARQ